MKRISTVYLVLFFINLSFAQSDGLLYPGLTGQPLINQLRADYKPAHVLGYDAARDTMFAVIDNHNHYVTGVYSGYTIYIDSTADPSTDAYNKDMNTEHTWPQSKGADTGNAHSDLHHLYPVRAEVNSSRSNDPFAEIVDTETDTWWRLDYSQSTIPTSNIDEYSEKDNSGYFEPREDHKGNVARSMFYFYTMYQDQADSNFFNEQKETLRQWNLLDSVDSAERQRSQLVARYQDGKENPFVLDTTLVRRAYFTPDSGSSGGDTTGSASAGDVIVTEIMQNPGSVDDTNGEWFEIYNTTSEAININHWYIRDNDTDEHQIENGSELMIEPHDYLVLGRNADSSANGGVHVDYQYSGFILANGADEVVLFSSDGTTEIDRVEYDGGPLWPDPNGASMYFTAHAEDDNNNPANWSVSQLPWQGSAGDAGSPGYGDIVSDIPASSTSLPLVYRLSNYPNPFGAGAPTAGHSDYATTIRYALRKNSTVRLVVYNTLGQVVKNLVDGRQSMGEHRVVFNGAGLASGIYFYRIQVGTDFKHMGKMILIR